MRPSKNNNGHYDIVNNFGEAKMCQNMLTQLAADPPDDLLVTNINFPDVRTISNLPQTATTLRLIGIKVFFFTFMEQFLLRK
jgi:hypothetical protein